MARTFGKLLCSVWDDPDQEDFRALTSDAKVLYWAFCSQSDITPAGIVPLTERRWRRWFHGDAATVEAAFAELTDGGWIMVDEDTAEVWVRTFIEHDGRLDNANLAKSVHNSVAEIRSEQIREACRRTLGALGAPSGRRSGAAPIAGSVDNRPSVPPDDQSPGNTPSEGRPDAVPTPSAREVELSEASKQDRRPQSSSQHRGDFDTDAPGVNGTTPAAAAALEIYVTHRLSAEGRNVRSSERYANSIRDREALDRASELAAVSADADPIAVAVAVFGLTRDQAIAAHVRNQENQ